MAVCNLFNALESATGNFMLFSQYVEDITRNYSDGNNWKVVPSRYVALNIDYTNVDADMVMPNDEPINVAVPKYLQNYFENSCAYGRSHYVDYVKLIPYPNPSDWTPELARNLFWNSMFDGKFLTTTQQGKTRVLNEVVYWDDINMHNYDEHKGMGYGEIYCYIPAHAPRKSCQVICITDTDPSGRKFDINNNNILLEGYTDKYIENYSKDYYYYRDFTMSFDDDDVVSLGELSDQMYEFNTIVVLYDIMKKVNDEWEPVYQYLPMGMQILGKIGDDGKVTNSAKKYVTTSYGTGTSYGLRICTRFSASPNGAILKNIETINDASISSTCTLLSAMAENLAQILNLSKTVNDTTQSYKDMLSTIKNNRTNVPYIKDVNGADWWFVNGRPVTSANSDDNCHLELSQAIIEKRIENLMDDDMDNDYTAIYDGTGCECEEEPIGNLVDHIQKCLDPEFEWDGPMDGACSHGVLVVSTDREVEQKLEEIL